MIRLRPSRIDLSSKDVEEASDRLRRRRAARASGSGKVGRPAPKVDERLLRGLQRPSWKPSREQDQGSNATGNSSEPRRAFTETVRSLLHDPPHGELVRNGGAQSSDPLVHYSLAGEAGDDLLGRQLPEEFLQRQLDDDDPPCHDERREEDDRFPFLSRSPSVVEHPGHDFHARVNDLWGQREEVGQTSFSGESFGGPRTSPEREFREVERRFAEGFNLDGSPSALPARSDVSYSSSSDPRTSSSGSRSVEGPSPPRQLSGSREGHEEPRRHKLPPSRLFISHTTLSSSPDKETLLPGGPQDGTQGEPRSMATRFLNRVRRYRQRTSDSFAESEPESNSTRREQSQDSQFPLGEVVSTDPLSSHPMIPLTNLEPSSISPETSEDLTSLTRFPPNVSFTPLRDPSLLSSHSTSPLSPGLMTPTPRSRRYPRYRSRSPLNHSDPPSSSPGPLANLIQTASRYLLPSSSPPASPPTQRSMRVYNDALPASIQPQTPSNRYTRPFNPAHTAPLPAAAGGGRLRLTQIFRRSRRQGRSGSLGRAASDEHGEQEQENVSAWVEVERWERRERRIRDSIERRRRRWRSSLSGIGLGTTSDRMEVEGEEGASLQRTPEREAFPGGAGAGMRME